MQTTAWGRNTIPGGCHPTLDDDLKLAQYMSSQLGYTVGVDIELPLGLTQTELTNIEDYVVATSGAWATKKEQRTDNLALMFLESFR